MKTYKSVAAYTNKWLNRNKHLWHIEHYTKDIPVIIIDKLDAPKVVIKRAKEINRKRGWDGLNDTIEHFMCVHVNWGLISQEQAQELINKALGTID